VLDTTQFAAWFPEIDGFPHPDWKAIRTYIRANTREDHFDAAWHEIIRTWLDRLRQRLGDNYAVAESENFHLLSELEPKLQNELLSFLEYSRARILRVLADIPLPKTYGKHVVLRFTTEDDYYRYISYSDPEGDHVGSSGVFITRGYMHIAFAHFDRPGSDRSILAHELAHNLLHSFRLPTWLNEGLAMLFERDLAGRQWPLLTREAAAKHAAYWNRETVQTFWSGGSFSDQEAQELSYQLARILIDFISTDIKPSPPDFREFVLHADRKDAGEAAARNYLGIELSDLVSAFLGPGEWRPRLKPQTATGTEGIQNTLRI